MIKVTPYRIYIFLFFTAAYSFLSYWISVSYFYKIIPFLIGGIFFYIFVVIFHKAIIRISEKNEDKNKTWGKINFFIIGLILFCIVYIIGMYGLQQITISFLGFPKEIFKIVNWFLTGLSLMISLSLSFFVRISKSGQEA